jgi:hypothetical protein
MGRVHRRCCPLNYSASVDKCRMRCASCEVHGEPVTFAWPWLCSIERSLGRRHGTMLTAKCSRNMLTATCSHSLRETLELRCMVGSIWERHGHITSSGPCNLGSGSSGWAVVMHAAPCMDHALGRHSSDTERGTCSGGAGVDAAVAPAPCHAWRTHARVGCLHPRDPPCMAACWLGGTGT